MFAAADSRYNLIRFDLIVEIFHGHLITGAAYSHRGILIFQCQGQFPGKALYIIRFYQIGRYSVL